MTTVSVFVLAKNSLRFLLFSAFNIFYWRTRSSSSRLIYSFNSLSYLILSSFFCFRAYFFCSISRSSLSYYFFRVVFLLILMLFCESIICWRSSTSKNFSETHSLLPLCYWSVVKVCLSIYVTIAWSRISYWSFSRFSMMSMMHFIR